MSLDNIIPTEEYCECCGVIIDKPEIHHWYEPPLLLLHQRRICRKCNMSLTTSKLWGFSPHGKTCQKWNHILPRWELQVAFATANINNISNIRGIIKEEYRDFVL
jgi:hypothetical protein